MQVPSTQWKPGDILDAVSRGNFLYFMTRRGGCRFDEPISISIVLLLICRPGSSCVSVHHLIALKTHSTVADETSFIDNKVENKVEIIAEME